MKKFCILIGFFFLMLSVLSFAAPPEDGLVLWFGFDEDLKNDIEDLSGSNNNGTVQNAVKWVKDGKYGGGMEFTNGWIKIPNSESLTFVDQLTLSLWINSDELLPVYRRIIGCGWASPGSYILGIDNFWMQTALAWDITNAAGTRTDANLNGLCVAGTWQFVAATYDGKVQKLYVDGEVKVQTVASGKINSAAEVSISQDGLGEGGGSFVGIMDEIRFYNRALDDNEIKQAMEEPGSKAVSPGGSLPIRWGKIKGI